MATAKIQADPAAGWQVRLKSWIATGTLVKTAAGLLIGAAGAIYGVYQHFAKASELEALRKEQIALIRSLSCDLASQAYISNKLGEANQRIRSALSELKRIRTIDDLPSAVNDAVVGIDEALAHVAQERDRIQRKKIIIGGSECNV